MLQFRNDITTNATVCRGCEGRDGGTDWAQEMVGSVALAHNESYSFSKGWKSDMRLLDLTSSILLAQIWIGQLHRLQLYPGKGDKLFLLQPSPAQRWLGADAG